MGKKVTGIGGSDGCERLGVNDTVVGTGVEFWLEIDWEWKA